MTTVFIARRYISQARQTQADLQASRDLRVLGVAASLFRAREGLARENADILFIDLRLEDGAALSLVRALRDRQANRPRVLVCAERPDDPLLFSTLVSGADAYLLASDDATLAVERLAVGEAAMAPFIAAQAMAFFPGRPAADLPGDDRNLDWDTDATNPLRLSPGEWRLLHLVAAGATSAAVAIRTAQSLPAIGRRITRLYRKLSWDVRSGLLSLQAA